MLPSNNVALLIASCVVVAALPADHHEHPRLLRRGCIAPSAAPNITFPDPDPSVNATLQLLGTGFTASTSQDLADLDSDDAISGTNDKRDLGLSLPKRVAAAGSSSGGSSSGGRSSGSSGSSAAKPAGAAKPAAAAKPASNSNSGGGKPGPAAAGSNSAKPPPPPPPPPKPPAAASLGTGGVVAAARSAGSSPPSAAKPASQPASSPRVISEQPTRPIYNRPLTPVNGYAGYYNDRPVSGIVTGPSQRLSYSSYSTTYYRTSVTYWGSCSVGYYSYPYWGSTWIYPAYIVMPVTTTNPRQTPPDTPSSSSSSISSASSSSTAAPTSSAGSSDACSFTSNDASCYEDPNYRSIAQTTAVVDMDNDGNLTLVSGPDQNNANVSWVGDHLLELGQMSRFFTSANLPNGTDWPSTWSSLQNCNPWPAAVTAIMNTPTNLIGLNEVVNHLKSLLLVTERGIESWTRSPRYYQALYEYLTTIRPNYLATAAAIDALIVQVSGSSSAKNVFAQWALDTFDNATVTLVSNAPFPK